MHRTPGGSRPVVYSSTAELLIWRHDSCPRRTIAVLPLVNLAHDPETLSFADTLAGQITTALTASRHCQVAALRSSFDFGKKQFAAPEIGRILGLRLLLGGSVQRPSANK